MVSETAAANLVTLCHLIRDFRSGVQGAHLVSIPRLYADRLEGAARLVAEYYPAVSLAQDGPGWLAYAVTHRHHPRTDAERGGITFSSVTWHTMRNTAATILAEMPAPAAAPDTRTVAIAELTRLLDDPALVALRHRAEVPEQIARAINACAVVIIEYPHDAQPDAHDHTASAAMMSVVPHPRPYPEPNRYTVNTGYRAIARQRAGLPA